MFNSFGNIFRLTSFGESHGKGNWRVFTDFRRNHYRRRIRTTGTEPAPSGQSILTTARKES